MSKLINRTVPLSPEEIAEFFEASSDSKGFLKYRLLLLRSGKEGAGGLVASLVACRMFIQFLGLKLEKKELYLEENRSYFNSSGRSDEVKVINLGGKFVYLHELKAEEKDLLAAAYHGANRATGHLTFGAEDSFDASRLPKVVDLICRLLKGHLYDVVGREM